MNLVTLRKSFSLLIFFLFILLFTVGESAADFLSSLLLPFQLVPAVSGSMILLNFLDPFSLAGRLITHLGDPVVAALRSTYIGILKYFDIYLFDGAMNPVPLSLLMTTVMFLFLIIFMSLRGGRLYCNTVCPVGTLLGLIARFSLFKISFKGGRCNDCGCCENVCKGGCIDLSKMQIDHSRCVNCFNCLKACSQSAISYRLPLADDDQKGWSPARRGFIFRSIAAAGSLALVFNSGIRNVAASSAVEQEDIPVTPPGSGGVAHFTNACSACHLCVNICPTKVLVPSMFAYGIGGFMQPQMDYRKSYCDFECKACGRVCPTGAIIDLPLADKKQTQIGVVQLLKEECIVYVKHQNCGACGEVCPTSTIYSVNKNDVLYPEIDDQYCIGCGACEKACPTEPKSIIVKSNPLHKKAVKYVLPAEVVQPKKADKDFPF
jgi:ferredoxin